MMRHACSLLFHIFAVILAPYFTHFCDTWIAQGEGRWLLTLPAAAAAVLQPCDPTICAAAPSKVLRQAAWSMCPCLNVLAFSSPHLLLITQTLPALPAVCNGHEKGTCLASPRLDVVPKPAQPPHPHPSGCFTSPSSALPAVRKGYEQSTCVASPRRAVLAWPSPLPHPLPLPALPLPACPAFCLLASQAMRRAPVLRATWAPPSTSSSSCCCCTASRCGVGSITGSLNSRSCSSGGNNIMLEGRLQGMPFQHASSQT